MIDYIKGTPGDAERRALIKTRGLEALGRVKNNQTYEDWRTIGEALLVITEEALAALNLPADGWDKDNQKLTREFTRRWDAWELSAGGNQKLLSRQERSSLRTLMTDQKYHVWYMDPLNFQPHERRKLNHPNAIINSYKATQRRKGPKAPTQMDKAVAEIERLHKQDKDQKAYIAEMEAARDDGDRFKRTDTAKDIATCLVGMFKPAKAREIANHMLELLKTRTPQEKVK